METWTLLSLAASAHGSALTVLYGLQAALRSPELSLYRQFTVRDLTAYEAN